MTGFKNVFLLCMEACKLIMICIYKLPFLSMEMWSYIKQQERREVGGAVKCFSSIG